MYIYHSGKIKLSTKINIKVTLLLNAYVSTISKTCVEKFVACHVSTSFMLNAYVVSCYNSLIYSFVAHQSEVMFIRGLDSLLI